MRYLRFGRRAAIIAVLLVMVTGFVSVVAASADTLPSLTPNDEFYPGINQTSAQYVNLPQAWYLTTGGPGIIGFADSGVNPDPDFGNRLLPGFCDLTTGCASPSDSGDPLGHGTDMASIAAAGINNTVGVAGVCGQCRVLPDRILNANDRFIDTDLANGINHLGSAGANVINLSLQFDPGTPPDTLVDNAIASVTNNGSLVVTAAGNFNPNNPVVALDDPANNVLASANPEAITVANIDPNTGQLEADSFRGSWVELAVPGSFTGDGTQPAEHGTSTAAAVLSGIAELVWKCAPSWTPAQVKADLINTGTPVPGLDVASGKVVNAYAAVLAAGCLPTVMPPPPPPSGGGGNPPPTQPSPAPTQPTPAPTTPAPTPVTPATLVTPVLVWVTVSHKGHGHVMRSPYQGKGYLPGAKVTLTAKPDKGWRFRSWGGACSGTTQATCKLVLLHRKTAVAVFVKARKSK